MISYLLIRSAKFVSQKDCPHLLDLVRLGIVSIALEIYLLIDSSFAEDVMAAADAFFKSETFEQRAEVVEANRCIGGPTENAVQSLRYSH
jgi:hypothetical protein